MRPTGSPRLPTNGLGYLYVHTWQLPLALLHDAAPFQIAFASVPLTHDLHSYNIIHCNMLPHVVQPIKVAASYSKRSKKNMSTYSLIGQPMYHIPNLSWGIVFTECRIGLVAHSRCYALRNITRSIVHMLSLLGEERYTP